MTATVRPDYSLTGESRQRAIEAGLANAEWFQPAIDPARLRELQTRTNARGVLRRRAVDRAPRRLGCVGLSQRLVVVVDPGVPALRRHVRRCRRPALARDGPRHGVPHPLAQRRDLPDRLGDAVPRTHRVAVVALPPPHRHDHRRPRCRDRVPTSTERRQDPPLLHRQGRDPYVRPARAATRSERSTPTRPSSCPPTSTARSSGSPA